MEGSEGLSNKWFAVFTELHESITKLENTVNEFKRLNSSVKEIEDMMGTITDNVAVGIVIMQDTKYVYVNKAAAQISGYSTEEVIGMSVLDTTVPSMRPILQAREKMILAGDLINFPEEWLTWRKDRTVKYVNVYAYRILYGGKPASMLFFYDITEKKRMEEDLSMKAELLDAVTDTVFLLDKEGNIRYVNDAGCKSRGYTRAEMLQMNILDITVPELRRSADIRIKQFSERKEVRFESVNIRKDGSRMPVEVFGRVVKRGKKSFLLGVAREINKLELSEKNGRIANGGDIVKSVLSELK